jgi:hypothetical protein
LERLVLPVDGTVDFPIDGRIRVVFEAFPNDLVAAIGNEYRLKDEKGKVVPIRSEADRNLLTLIPVGGLKPGTRYILEKVIAYDSAGEKVDDNSRWGGWFKQESVRDTVYRVFFKEISFVTGYAKDNTVPRAPMIIKAKVKYYYGHGDCGPGGLVSVGVRNKTALGSSDVYSLEEEGIGVFRYFTVNDRSAHWAVYWPLSWLLVLANQYFDFLSPQNNFMYGDTSCLSFHRHVDRKGNIQVRVVVISSSGKRSSEMDWTKVTVDKSWWKDFPPERKKFPDDPEFEKEWVSSLKRWFAPLLMQPKNPAISKGPIPLVIKADDLEPVPADGK